MRYLTLVPLLLVVSCLQDFDEEETSFEKVIGSELGSIGNIAMEMDNGNLVFVGSVGLEPFIDDENLGLSMDQNKILPAITVTDKNGNFLYRRVYPMDSVFFNDPGWGFMQGLTIRSPLIGSLWMGKNQFIELTNGNYVAQIFFSWEVFGIFFPGTLLMFLDEDLNLIDVRPSHGDIDHGDPQLRYRQALGIFEFTDGDIGILNNFDIDFQTGNPLDRRFGLTKLSLSNNFLWSRTYPENLPPFNLQPGLSEIVNMATDGLVDADGNFVVLSTEVHNWISIDTLQIHKLSPTDGSIIASAKLGGPGEEHFGHLIHELDDGYVVIKAYDDNDDSSPKNEENGVLALSFFDRDLQFQRDVLMDHIAVGAPCCNNSLFMNIRASTITQDGNLVILIREDQIEESTILLKTDLEGNVIWEQRFPGNPFGVMETRDGGLVVAMRRQFNGLDSRLHVLKLTADGEL